MAALMGVALNARLAGKCSIAVLGLLPAEQADRPWVGEIGQLLREDEISKGAYGDPHRR